ncbi:MAG: DUF748 domain-containing protein [Methylotenera sp.]|nr:DUF748 domain-containing protein [Methylotenera sp.]
MINRFKSTVLESFISLPAKLLIGLFVFYCLFGYFAINPLAQKMVPWIANEKLASNATIGKVSFDPLRLKTTLENFKLTEKNGALLASFENLTVDFEASGIFNRAWKFNEISLTAPQANIAISSQGKLNWADLIAKLDEDKTPPDDTIPRVLIKHIAVKNGSLEYLDAYHRALPLKAALTPLAFELDGFSTLPQDRGDYLIAATFPEQGGTLKWKGNMGVNPVASKGALAVDGVKLAKLMHIVKGTTLPFMAKSGDIQTSFDYDFSLPNDLPKLTLNKISLGLHDVAGDTSTGELSLKQANLTMPSLAFLMQKEPELHLHDMHFTMAELSLTQGQETNIALKQAEAKLPQLDFAMHNAPQVQFQDLNLNLADLSINKGREHLLTLPQMAVNQVSLDLAAHHAKIEQILLPQASVKAVMDKSGVINWQQAFASPSNTTEPSIQVAESTATSTAEETPFSLDIADVQLQHWKLAFLDQTFLNPLQVNVADFNLSLALSTPKGDLSISKMQSKMTGISAQSAPNHQVASLDRIQLADGEIKLAEQKVSIPSLTLTGLKTQLIKEANKPLNWQMILTPVAINTTNNKLAKPSTKQPDWAVSLKKIALENANLHVEDRSLTTPVILDVEKINVEVRDSSLDLKRALPVKAAFQIKQGGQFSSQGQLTPAPLAADFDLKLNGFSLKLLAPYINQFALLKLNDGAAEIGGKLAIKNNQDLALTFNGGFGVNNLQIVEEANNAPFLSWERVASNSLQVSLAPNRVQMAELQIIKPIGKFIIHQDKSMNVTRMLRNQPVSSAPEAPVKEASAPVEQSALPSSNGLLAAAKSSIASDAKNAEDKPFTPPPIAADAEAEDFPVSIEAVKIDNAALEFADLSLTPQFGTNIHSLTGVINGVSTNASSTAQVELDGRVDDYGAASIRGSLQPFKATNFTDLKLAFTNLEMNRLTPYSGKFAGRRIDSGKLSVDLEYKIKQRQLAGENKFVIHKLKLGEKIESAEAANLPLDLAIAILEDSDGVIDLDLPITGSLDDPKFSYGSIVWKAIRNVLGKIVTAPFRALGKLFGGSGDKLEAITFEAGSATLSPPELEKLKMVSTALSKRQGLTLGVVPSFDAAIDTRAIQESTLRRKVAENMGTLAEGQQAGPIDLTSPKVQKAIDDLYDTLTKKSLFKKLASKFEKPKESHYQEAQEKLTMSIEVKEADLQALAKARAQAIQKILVDAGIAQTRIQIDKTEQGKADSKAKNINTRLTLDAKAVKQQNTGDEKVVNLKPSKSIANQWSLS